MIIRFQTQKEVPPITAIQIQQPSRIRHADYIYHIYFGLNFL